MQDILKIFNLKLIHLFILVLLSLQGIFFIYYYSSLFYIVDKDKDNIVFFIMSGLLVLTTANVISAKIRHNMGHKKVDEKLEIVLQNKLSNYDRKGNENYDTLEDRDKKKFLSEKVYIKKAQHYLDSIKERYLYILLGLQAHILLLLLFPIVFDKVNIYTFGLTLIISYFINLTQYVNDREKSKTISKMWNI